MPKESDVIWKMVVRGFVNMKYFDMNIFLYKSNLRNVYGTFAIEGMTISKATRSNLDRIGSGQASWQEVVEELRAKYDHPDNA